MGIFYYMAKKLMSVDDYKNFSLFKERYKNIMLTYDEWNSLFWADPENISYIGELYQGI